MGHRSHDRRADLQQELLGDESGRTQDVPAGAARQYLNAEQLSGVTPWSTSAIEKMVARGVLLLNVHYFQPFGHRTQLVFKWSAIVSLIEGNATDVAGPIFGSLEGGVEKATASLRGLLSR